MSERDADEGDLEWGGVMEECKGELSCVCHKIAQAVGWHPGTPYRAHAPKPNEKRQRPMRTSKGEAFVYIKR